MKLDQSRSKAKVNDKIKLNLAVLRAQALLDQQVLVFEKKAHCLIERNRKVPDEVSILCSVVTSKIYNACAQEYCILCS